MSPKKPSKGAGDASPQRDLEVMKELLALLESSGATSLRLTRGDTTYEVHRGGRPELWTAGLPVAPPVHPAGNPAAPSAAGPTPAAAASTLTEIKSPMVGTFYRAPEPGAEPYVKVGARVAPGQTLCIIEAMKIMNELESEVSGVIHEILVEDAQPVEFGQVLFRVEPNV
jgi:acetyl-CoA carboxylase biotin carboxyl carrier protein